MSLPTFSRRSALIATLVVVLTGALAGFALAQAPTSPPADAPVLDAIRRTYQTAARGWLPRLIPIAQRLFVLLAGC